MHISIFFCAARDELHQPCNISVTEKAQLFTEGIFNLNIRQDLLFK